MCNGIFIREIWPKWQHWEIKLREGKEARDRLCKTFRIENKGRKEAHEWTLSDGNSQNTTKRWKGSKVLTNMTIHRAV
jgi:hypothetical protein